MLLLRLTPLVPFNLLNYALGCTAVSIQTLHASMCTVLNLKRAAAGGWGRKASRPTPVRRLWLYLGGKHTAAQAAVHRSCKRTCSGDMQVQPECRRGCRADHSRGRAAADIKHRQDLERTIPLRRQVPSCSVSGPTSSACCQASSSTSPTWRISCWTDFCSTPCFAAAGPLGGFLGEAWACCREMACFICLGSLAHNLLDMSVFQTHCSCGKNPFFTAAGAPLSSVLLASSVGVLPAMAFFIYLVANQLKKCNFLL